MSAHRRSSLVLLAILMMFVTVPSANAKGQKYAILIGVRNYESTALRELAFAENDVSQLAEVLKANGFTEDDIVLMTATHAVKSRKPRFHPRAKNIRRELKLYLGLPRKGDIVVVALAGHGVQLEGDKEHYFCPVDADLENKKNLISVTDLYKTLEGCKADVKLLLVDACRNDPLLRNVPRSVADKVASKTRPVLAAPPGGIAAFFSCSRGQQAYEAEALKRGVFFHFIIEGLRGKAANRAKQVTIGSLTEYVSREVPEYAVKVLRANQRPELLGRHNPSVPLVILGKSLPKTKTVTLPGGVKMEFVLVPKGTFWMSADGENAQNRVTIPHDFYIGKYEVTQEQWQAVMGQNPSKFSRNGGDDDEGSTPGTAVPTLDVPKRVYLDRVKGIPGSELKRFPVENVSWHDCQKFLKKMNEKNREREWSYRLPKESEWEYACRGGVTSKEECSYHFYFGKPTNSLSSKQANFSGDHPDGDAVKGPFLKRTTKVGSYAPNVLGVYDMHGNVWEWCDDWYPKGKLRVFRGGSWLSNGKGCRASYRWLTPPPWGPRHDIGFRVAVVPSKR